MQLEPDEKKPLTPAEQIEATALELQLAADVLGGLVQGQLLSHLLPLPAMRTLEAMTLVVSGAAAQLLDVRATLQAKPPRPTPPAPPPVRAHKKPARTHTRPPEAPAPAKPPRSNGTAAAPPGPSEAAAKPVP